MTKTKVTRREAEQVLAAVKRQCKTWLGEGSTPPVLRENWSWTGPTYAWAIIWEEGPYEWTYLFPHGGIEEEFGFNLKAVNLPAGVWTEAITSWAIAIYPKDW